MAAFVDELPGQPQVLFGPGLAVQLNESGLDDGMTIQPLPRTEERGGQVIGEPSRGVDEPSRASRPGVRDRRLEQVARAVQLVRPLQLRVPLLAGDLDVRVQVPVWLLRLLQERRRLLGELGQARRGAARLLPADRLQRLVEVGVHEDGAAVARMRPLRGQLEVVDVPRFLQHVEAVRQ